MRERENEMMRERGREGEGERTRCRGREGETEEGSRRGEADRFSSVQASAWPA